VDAIRSSWRLVHAVGVRPVAPPTAPPKADESIAAEEAVGKAAGSDVTEQPPDPQPRELWARDMAVRAEDASRTPDGSLSLLPTYDYQLGPDGLPYAVAPGVAAQQAVAAQEADAPPVTDAPPELPESPTSGADEHVLRSYARLDDVEGDAPPQLDTVA